MAYSPDTQTNGIFLNKVEKALNEALSKEQDRGERRQKLESALSEVNRTREALEEKIADQ